MMITFGRCESAARAHGIGLELKGKRKLDDEEDDVADLSDYGDDEDDEPLAPAAAPIASPAKRAADRAVECSPRRAADGDGGHRRRPRQSATQIAPVATALQSKWTSIFRTFIPQSKSKLPPPPSRRLPSSRRARRAGNPRPR